MGDPGDDDDVEGAEPPLPLEHDDATADTDVVAETTARRLSSRDRQAETRAFDALAKALVALPQADLEKLALDELTPIIAGARSTRKSARVRELRRIATALRQRDAKVVAQQLRELRAPDRAEVQRLKECEDWRDRLLEGGDAVLGELVDAHPSADRQRLRQLVRAAGKDRSHAKSQHAYRELFREIRSLTKPTTTPTTKPTSE